MATNLEGRVVVVTGGNAGIGLGIAEGCARSGADIAIWSRRADKNEEAAERLRAHGRETTSDDLGASVHQGLRHRDPVFARLRAGATAGAVIQDLREILRQPDALLQDMARDAHQAPGRHRVPPLGRRHGAGVPAQARAIGAQGQVLFMGLQGLHCGGLLSSLWVQHALRVERLAHRMGDHQRRQAEVSNRPAGQVDDELRHAGVERGGMFVEQQHTGFRQRCHDQSERLALTAR